MALIYFDNAATSRIKPDEVYDAFNFYLREIGTSPGRGTYSLGVQSSRMLYQVRKTIADYFGVSDSSRVIFTKSSTEAINLFTNGFLLPHDHVLLSCFEHNAVLRPVHNLSQNNGITYSVVPEHCLYADDLSCFDKYINSKTRVAFFTLASNLTGQIVYKREIGKYLNKKGIAIFVDASQGAGKMQIDMARDYIDFLAFTGHKDLHGLPGTGGLCSASEFSVPPLIQGGTGIYGDNYINPSVYPEVYEAGTLNMPAIWALKSAFDFSMHFYNEHKRIEKRLTEHLLSELMEIPGIVVYNADKERIATLCFNVCGMRSDEVVKTLDEKNICVRGGIHCTILAHEALGTVETGSVRVSLDYNNTVDEVVQFVSCIKEMR